MAQRLALVVLVGVAVVLLVACGGSTSAADAELAKETIAFTVNRQGFGEIWVMDQDGGNRMQLTESGGSGTDANGNGSPAWAPDGSFIAYAGSGDAVEEDPHDGEIYVMRADGTETNRLTNDRVGDVSPTWSPDGEKIAFAHLPGAGTVEAKGVIVVMDADGGDRVEITDHSGTQDIVYESEPAWSPDGSLIAFTRTRFTRDGKTHTGIYVVAPSGENEQLLIEDAAQPAWSPDGESIAFTSGRDGFGKTCFQECSPSSEIYVAAADGTDLRRLTESEATDHSPAWSPDGERIAFTSDRSNRDSHDYEIYVLEPDGNGVRRLTTNDVWDLEPAWR